MKEWLTTYKTIQKMFENQLVDGLNLPLNYQSPLNPCAGCLSGKMRRSPFPIGCTRAAQIGQLIHSDVCGPMHIATPGGSRFFVTFIDDFSGWRAVFCIKNKSDVLEALKTYIGTLRSETGQLVHTLRSDNGGEFTNTDFKKWISNKGIKLETSTPNSPEKNGVAKRANWTIIEGARSLIHAKNLPIEIWGEAESCTVYVLNHVKTSNSPINLYELWFGKKPNISHFRFFGSIAYFYIPKSEPRKNGPKRICCYFVGYSLTQKAYHIWIQIKEKFE